MSLAEQRRVFWLLVAAFGFSAVAMAIPVLFLPVMEGLGFGATAVIAGTVFGPSQTGARALEILASRRWDPLKVAVGSTALFPVSLLILAFGGTSFATAVIFAVLYGAGHGISYVIRGTVALALFGPEGYATRLGKLATARLLVVSMTPLIMAVILQRVGPHAAVLVCAAAGVAATLCFAVIALRHGK